MGESYTLPRTPQYDLAQLTSNTMEVLGYAKGSLESPAKWSLVLMRLLNKGHDPSAIEAVARHYRDTYGEDTVRRYDASGLELGFDRMLREMTAKQLSEMTERIAAERKAAQ
jgi:hypothetical protein